MEMFTLQPMKMEPIEGSETSAITRRRGITLKEIYYMGMFSL